MPANSTYVACICQRCGKEFSVTTYARETYGMGRFCSFTCRCLNPDPYTVNAETGCWQWGRTTNGRGYGTLNRRGKKHYAHRYYWEMHRGPIPQGMEIDHLCHNRGCVNPDHMQVVDRRTNCRRTSRSRLTEADVVRIRELAPTTTRAAIAREYGIDASTVSNIVNGKAWT